MINLIRVLLFHRDFIILIIVSLLSVILIFSNRSEPILVLQSKITNIYSKIFKPLEWYRNILLIEKENVILKKKITKLNLINIQLQYLERENNRLNEMLNFTKEINLELIPTNIIKQNFSPTIHSFTIDIGKYDSLRKNQAVIDMDGLIGKIYNLNDHSSIIQVLSDKYFRVSIRVGQDKILGVFKPTHGLYGILDGIPKSQNVKINDLVVSSGISDIYPADIPVAKVINVNVNPNDLFQDILVEILADIYNPKYLFLIN